MLKQYLFHLVTNIVFNSANNFCKIFIPHIAQANTFMKWYIHCCFDASEDYHRAKVSKGI